jgi:ketopantoate reductase
VPTVRAIDEAAAVAAAYGGGVCEAERREIFDALLDPNEAGASTTSMYRDLKAGRPTEVDCISARDCDGRCAAIATPPLKTLAAVIKGTEARNGTA